MFPIVFLLFVNSFWMAGSFLGESNEIYLERTEMRPLLQPEVDSVAMVKNKLYTSILEDYENLSAIYLQQPGNTAALVKYSLNLKSKVDYLGSLDYSEGTVELAQEVATKPSNKGEISAPQGPVNPTNKPSSPEDTQRQVEATSEFYSGPVSQNKPGHSLSTVPDLWIVQSMDRASGQLEVLCAQFGTDHPDTKLVQNTLKDLGKTLYKTCTPPPGADETDPKG